MNQIYEAHFFTEKFVNKIFGQSSLSVLDTSSGGMQSGSNFESQKRLCAQFWQLTRAILEITQKNRTGLRLRMANLFLQIYSFSQKLQSSSLKSRRLRPEWNRENYIDHVNDIQLTSRASARTTSRLLLVLLRDYFFASFACLLSCHTRRRPLSILLLFISSLKSRCSSL